jgi:isoleucyl-tRNA synthetase
VAPHPDGEPARLRASRRFPAVRPELADDALAETWERLLAVRDEVLRHLEAARKDKTIGSAQEAAVTLTAAGPEAEFLEAHREDLETICIVSRLTVSRDAGAPALGVVVDRALGTKCPRCWNYREDIGRAADHPALCGRCAEALRSR